MDQRLGIMENKLNDVESKLDSMDKKLNQVVEALMGNPLVKDDGLVGKLNDIQGRVKDHDEVLKKVKYFWVGVVAVGGAIALIIEFINKIFK